MHVSGSLKSNSAFSAYMLLRIISAFPAAVFTTVRIFPGCYEWEHSNHSGWECQVKTAKTWRYARELTIQKSDWGQKQMHGSPTAFGLSEAQCFTLALLSL